MPSQQVQAITAAFSYLFADFGFEVTSERHFEDFGNWVVVLQSKSCGRIRIMQDRGEILVALGPPWSPPTWEAGPWFGLDVVIEYLTGRQARSARVAKEPGAQLSHLAAALRQIIQDTCSLFQSTLSDEQEGELAGVRQRIEDELWVPLLRKGDR